jgi:hypothetical protein
MVTLALKATSHFAAWLIYQATGVSVLDELDTPEQPD